MAAKKKTKAKKTTTAAPKSAAKKPAPKKKAKAAAKKKAKAAPKKKAKAAPKKAKAAPKKKAKAAPKKAKAAPKKKAPVGHAITALPHRARVVSASTFATDQHLATAADFARTKSAGLRGDGEIVHVEEQDYAPCRLVDHGDGHFSLCFDDYRMPELPGLKERGLANSGYTWEALVKALVRMRQPQREESLSYDSEAGMFVALAEDRADLLTVARLIQEATRNPQTLQDALERLNPDEL